MAGGLEASERAELKDFLSTYFSLSEIKELCFDIGVGFDDLPHSTKTEVCIELIGYFERRNNVAYLINEVLKRRNDESGISRLLAKLPYGQPRRKIELVVANISMELRTALKGVLDEILSSLAQLLGLQPGDIAILGLQPGSVRILLGLPEQAAGRLRQVAPTSLAGGKYVVSNLRPFETLAPAMQQVWRSAADKVGTVAGTAAKTGLATSTVLTIVAVATSVLLLTAIVVLAVVSVNRPTEVREVTVPPVSFEVSAAPVSVVVPQTVLVTKEVVKTQPVSVLVTQEVVKTQPVTVIVTQPVTVLITKEVNITQPVTVLVTKEITRLVTSTVYVTPPILNVIKSVNYTCGDTIRIDAKVSDTSKINSVKLIYFFADVFVDASVESTVGTSYVTNMTQDKGIYSATVTFPRSSLIGRYNTIMVYQVQTTDAAGNITLSAAGAVIYRICLS